MVLAEIRKTARKEEARAVADASLMGVSPCDLYVYIDGRAFDGIRVDGRRWLCGEESSGDYGRAQRRGSAACVDYESEIGLWRTHLVF